MLNRCCFGSIGGAILAKCCRPDCVILKMRLIKHNLDLFLLREHENIFYVLRSFVMFYEKVSLKQFSLRIGRPINTVSLNISSNRSEIRPYLINPNTIVNNTHSMDGRVIAKNEGLDLHSTNCVKLCPYVPNGRFLRSCYMNLWKSSSRIYKVCPSLFYF